MSFWAPVIMTITHFSLTFSLSLSLTHTHSKLFAPTITPILCVYAAASVAMANGLLIQPATALYDAFERVNIVLYSPLLLFMAKNPSGLPDVMRYVIFCSGSLSPSSAINCNTFTPAGLLSATDG